VKARLSRGAIADGEGIGVIVFTSFAQRNI
jgi:hypothetical protein